MAEEESFEDGLDVGFVVGFEVVDGFECEAELVVGVAFVFVEREAVDGDVECEGGVAEHVKGGCGGVCFVAADLGDVDPNVPREGPTAVRQ